MTNMDVSALRCSSCEEVEPELYYCDTCNQSEECSKEVTKELMCESCISSHVKKSHDVRTAKGQVPLVCPDHKKLHNLYCKTCDTTFCPKCMRSHSHHELGNMDEKATEIKKEVFEMLCKLESDEKPLKAKKIEISDMKEVHKSEQCELREVFEDQIETLRQIGLKRIDENLSHFDVEEKDIEENVDRVLDIQKSSRDLLALTTPRLMKDFKQVKADYDKVCKMSKETFASSLKFKSSQINVIKDIFDRVTNEVDKKLQTNFARTDERKPLKKFAVMGYNWSNFVFSVENGKLKVTRLRIGDGVNLEYQDQGEVEFSEDVKSFFSINDSNYLCSCILFTQSSTSVFRIDITKSNVCQRTKMTLPSFPNIMCPFILDVTNKQVHWCYWAKDRNVLKFSHNTSYEIECSASPIWKSRELGAYQLCYTTEKNEILIINPSAATHEIIPQITHKVDSIDQVAVFGRWLFVWSFHAKSIILMSQQNNQWNVVETQKWHEATKVVSFNDPYVKNLRCLPAFETSSADDHNSYSFVTLSCYY